MTKKEYDKAYRESHKEQKRESNREYYLNHKDQQAEHYQNNKDQVREYNLNKRYNLTLEEYELLLEDQSYQCPICKCNLKELDTKKIHVDHDHETKVVRGVLCNYCNVGLGHFKDDAKLLQSAINYLTESIKQWQIAIDNVVNNFRPIYFLIHGRDLAVYKASQSNLWYYYEAIWDGVEGIFTRDISQPPPDNSLIHF